ncbi:MAG: 3-ketoacyl-ACP synthase [Archangiaceae bacterium]|nr:3-ketoacyl-ACP synthase [Archangiaceae bacterium]
MRQSVSVVGVGDFTPDQIVTNQTMARAIPGWNPELIRERTGIIERRFLCGIDEETGLAITPVVGLRSNTDMAELALWDALKAAGLSPQELDAVFVVTCTPDRPDFNYDAMELHRRFELRPDTTALVVNDGCGGTPYVIDLAQKLIGSGAMNTVAVVASNFASAFVDRKVYCDTLELTPGKPLSGYLSMYVFGDGAGAVVLRGTAPGEHGVLRSTSGNGHESLVLRRGGGAELPFLGAAARPVDFAFVVNGHEVAQSYPKLMRQCLSSVGAEQNSEVKRYYLHQPNKRVLDRFSAQAGLSADTVASTVEFLGNTSAAGTLVALSMDLKQGRVSLGSGDLVCLAAAGANVHWGAQLIRL